tara:strand:+ start:338 stop:1408 length:1071 start_codon:yes stop_codon:yes gene_type:complete
MNPYYFFSITPLSLMLYFNLGSFYMQDLSHETYLLAIINMSGFVFALSLTSSYKKVRSSLGTNSSRDLIVHSVILYLLSLSAKFIPFLSSVLWVFSIPAIACAVKSKKKIMLIFVALIIGSSMFGETSKMSVLLNVLTALITYEKYYNVNVNSKIKIFFYVIFGIFFMIYSFSFAIKDNEYMDVDEGVEYYSKNGVDWSLNATLFMPYMYLTTPWSNLQYVTETQTEKTNGLWTFKPLLGYVQLDDSFEKDYELEAYSSFNTFTYIVCAYKDFGFWGSVVMSFFLGFFVKKIYSRYKVSESPFDVAIYVCTSLAVVEMFFSNHFFMQSYPFTIVIVMGIYRIFISLINQKKFIVSN